MNKLLAFLAFVLFAHGLLLPPIAQPRGDAMVLFASGQAKWSTPAAKPETEACCQDPESNGAKSVSTCSADCHYLQVEVLMLPTSRVAEVFSVAPPADALRDMIVAPMKPPILS